MKLKGNYFFTLREDIKDEDSISGKLLTKSGMIKKSSNGIYMFLPFGYKVLKNIENIIREEMNSAGSLELTMPAMISKEIYDATGRAEAFGNSVFSLKDRHNRDYILAPTHEELFALASIPHVKSYKDLPFSMYQFQTKYRDEPRPRFGLIRVREFVMKDAYSFDRDLEGLDLSYQKMFNAYKRSFDRMNIDYKIVTADTGMMGGLLSEEFQAITDIGEDTLVLCNSCDYATNIEIAPYISDKGKKEEKLPKEEIHTPNTKTIEDLKELLPEYKDKLVKALMVKADGKLCFVFILGNRELNFAKLEKLLNTGDIELATDEEIENNSNGVVGFSGPVDLKVGKEVKVIVDDAVLKLTNFVTGANKKDYHLINVNVDDIKYDLSGDVSLVKEGDTCPKCRQKLVFKKGIEIGNTFKLGTKYSESLGLTYLDQNNQLQPVVMGSYGIGPARCMASIVEQSHDEKGIIWPESIAPFKVCLVVANSKDEQQVSLAEQIYQELKEKNIDILYDDRDERLGVKLNDMDLIGIPKRILVGKKSTDNIVEFKQRNEAEIEEIKIEDIIDKVQ